MKEGGLFAITNVSEKPKANDQMIVPNNPVCTRSPCFLEICRDLFCDVNSGPIELRVTQRTLSLPFSFYTSES